MKFFIHHLKTEYHLNSKLLWFILAFLTFMGFIISIDATNEESIQLIWFCILSGVFLSTAYKRDFSLKYYMALPVPRDQLVLLMIFGRTVYFLPGLIVFNIFYSSIPQHDIFNYNRLSAFLAYFIIVSLYNATQVLGDIENPRVETVPGRFDSFLMFFKRFFINFMLGGTLVITGLVLLGSFVEAIGLTALNNQFLMVIYGAAVLTFMLYRCHQVLLNEHLTYWSWKRDGTIASFFILASVLPALMFKDIIGHFAASETKTYFHAIDSGDIEKIKELQQQGIDASVADHRGLTPVLYSIYRGNLEALKTLESFGLDVDVFAKVPLDKIKRFDDGHVQALHLAILSNNPEMLDYIFTKPDIFNAAKKEVHKNSPLFFAAKYCNAQAIVDLLNFGEDPNQRLENHKTPLMIATHSDCYTGAIELLSAQAKLDLKDKEGKTVFDYAAKKPQMQYFLEKFSTEKVHHGRLPASSNLAFPSTKR
jgi:hypothetical protein